MFKHITIEQLIQLQAEKNVHIADTRDAQSYTAGHIKGAIHLDNSSVTKFVSDTDFNEPVVVCCYHGNSSQGAAQYLFEQGFSEAYSLDGGFEFFKVSQPNDVSQG
jgi:thiosulfate sulfurtransferase